MTAKEYLEQAYRLDQWIQAKINELDQMRSMAQTISSPGLEERYNASRSTASPFTRKIEKIVQMEDDLNREIDKLVDLKAQILLTINSVQDPTERILLQYRYIEGMRWDDIAVALSADVSTIRRWHGKALSHVVMPKDPIQI